MGNVNVIDIGTLKDSIRDFVKIYKPTNAATFASWYANKFNLKDMINELEKMAAKEIEKQSESQTE